MKRTLYHGTSYENYKSIKKERGFNCVSQNWLPSDNLYTYFWNTHKFIEQDTDKNDTLEERLEQANLRAIQQAFESAEVCASIHKSKADKIVVLKVEIEEEFILDDDSSENMDLSSKVAEPDIKWENIREAYYKDFSPHEIFLHLMSVINNEHICLGNFFSSYEIKIIELLGKSDVCDYFFDERSMMPFFILEKFHKEIK